MAKQIIWAPLAEKDFISILEYLHENWGERVVNGFIEITSAWLTQISINPKQFPMIYKTKKIRKCVLTKHNTLFYRDRKGSIDVLRIFDNRQDPSNLKF